MDLIIPFVSIIGVTVGFLLSTLKEWIQNKPKIKMDMKMGKFNYYRIDIDELGQQIVLATDPQHAEFYEVNLQLDVYNYGKGNTAIKSINVENIINKSCLIYSEVELEANLSHHISSFNLPASNIMTLDMKWRIDKEDNTESLFNEEIISLESGRLQFKVIARSIKNKKYKLIVEPLSIITAYK